MSNGELLYITDSSGATKRADSINEYNFGIALQLEELEFLFQFSIFGGFRTLGGVAVDFLVWTPFATPVEIVGAYWHQNTSKERFRSSIIRQYFGRDVVEVSEEQSETVEAARSFIKRVIK